MTQPETLATPLTIGPVTIGNRVFLAPMSGVTDEPFRARAVAHGAGLVVSEMIASGELIRGRQGSARRLKRPSVPVHVVQLAGREAEAVAQAARIAEGEGADIIDINMGCPAKKVTGGLCGSALMREPDLAMALVSAAVKAVSVPVTVKMRLGWDEATLNAPEIARRAVGEGAQAITVHARTRCQFYNGRADWNAVARVREAVNVPLVVNGDIGSAADALAAMQASGADAVMIGRAAYGQPWLPGAVAGAGAEPADIAAYVGAHYEDMLGLYGREAGCRHARKHLGWYLDRRAPQTPALLRGAIMTGTEPAAVAALLRAAFDAASDRAAAA